jgi:hypothetical protein
VASDAAADLAIRAKHCVTDPPRVDPMVIERVVKVVDELTARARSHCAASDAVGNDKKCRSI